MDEKAKKILISLQRQCAGREYCSSEIIRKAVTRLDGDVDAAKEIAGRLIEDKYVDDARYAAAFARDKSTLAGWGPVKISHALRAKGIGRETIEEALDGIDVEKASDKLGRIMASRKKALGGDPQARLKLLRFALSRGYEYDEVSRILDTL